MARPAPRGTSTGPIQGMSKQGGGERVAGVELSRPDAALEPGYALCAGSMRKRLRNYGAARAALQRIVADLRCGVESGLDIAVLEAPAFFSLGSRGPYT